MVADGPDRVLYHLLWTVQVPDHYLQVEIDELDEIDTTHLRHLKPTDEHVLTLTK